MRRSEGGRGRRIAALKDSEVIAKAGMFEKSCDLVDLRLSQEGFRVY